MEQQIFKYPYYRANQFLTSQYLNESLSYVEEQERLTRIKMIGNGILSGLNFDSALDAGNDVTEISIKNGFGITADGYSVSFSKDVEYKYMVAYADFTSKEDTLNPELSFFKPFQGIRYLLFTTEEIASKKFIFNPDIVKPVHIQKSEYEQCCLAVAVEQKTETSYNCNPSDCNINSSYKNIVYRPVLVDISKLEKINSYYSPLNYLHIHKLMHISEIKSAEACQKKIQTLVEANVKIIEEYLDETATQVAGLLPRENVLLKKALKTFRKSINGDVSIYYLACLNDLQTAINEFVNVHNNFIHKYAFSSAARQDLLLVLGRIPQAGNDLYRYFFTETAAGESFVADNKILSAMFRRIAALLEYFMPAKELTALLSHLTKSSFKYSRLLREKITYDKIKIAPIKDVSKCIKIIPCKGYSEKIGCRSIPYYYNILENSHALDMNDLWHAHDMDPALDMVYNYYWCNLSRPQNYEQEFMLNLETYPFYRIEGHLGLPITNVYDYLKSLINELDIPVQLIKVDVTNHAWNKFRDDFETFTEKYKEFLKIDFPRVPYPKDKTTFKKLVKFGTELRSLHLLESQKVNQFITTYPITGNNEVEKIKFEKAVTLRQAQGDKKTNVSLNPLKTDTGKVYINKEQYFGNVPEIAWNFYIGGYQPAQKWLKDRKGRTLTNSDIEHYQKIIVALTETGRIMKEIDEVMQELLG